MAQNTHREIEDFVQELQRFHDSLPQSQQVMLEAILAAAEEAEADDTSGHMMSTYMVEASARNHMADLHQQAARERLAGEARHTAQGEQVQPRAASEVFGRLSGWLSTLLARPQEAR